MSVLSAPSSPPRRAPRAVVDAAAGLVFARRCMTKASHYRLERTRVVDHAGTTWEEAYLTVSRDRLVGVVRDTVRSGHFIEDDVAFAWEATITRGYNAVAEHDHPSLTVFDGGVETRFDLVPDMTITRGAERLCLQMVRVAKRRRPKVRVGGEGGAASKTYASLAKLGDDEALLKPLREAQGLSLIHI